MVGTEKVGHVKMRGNMSENRNPGLRRGAKIAGLGAVAAVAMGLLSTGAANADVFVPLPDGQKSGPGYSVGHVASSAIVSPSLAMNGAGRTVWVSGKAWADVTVTPEGEEGPNNGPAGENGTNNSSTHGTSQLNTGYIVGCQVDVSGLTGVLGGDIEPLGLTGNATALLSIPIAAGEVKWVDIQSKDITKPGRYALDYQDVQLEIQGCGGYAQARSYTNVEIIGDHYIKGTLYGQPFSIG